MRLANVEIDTSLPYWADYRELLESLAGESFPDTGVLNRLLRAGTSNDKGNVIRFVPACELTGVAYEHHIHETGEVSTREKSWHDLFNALVWCRLPRLKAAMNVLHYRNLSQENSGHRGRMRDALTLLDESGVIVVANDKSILEDLARRDWDRTFTECKPHWGVDLRVIVCGHALLEKFLRPYKAITAHAVLLKLDDLSSLREIDEILAEGLLENHFFNSPSDLSPLPLMGIPGWWNGSVQDNEFYADRNVFRLPPGNFSAAPVYEV